MYKIPATSSSHTIRGGSQLNELDDNPGLNNIAPQISSSHGRHAFPQCSLRDNDGRRHNQILLIKSAAIKRSGHLLNAERQQLSALGVSQDEINALSRNKIGLYGGGGMFSRTGAATAVGSGIAYFLLEQAMQAGLRKLNEHVAQKYGNGDALKGWAKVGAVGVAGTAVAGAVVYLSYKSANKFISYCDGLDADINKARKEILADSSLSQDEMKEKLNGLELLQEAARGGKATFIMRPTREVCERYVWLINSLIGSINSSWNRPNSWGEGSSRGPRGGFLLPPPPSNLLSD